MDDTFFVALLQGNTYLIARVLSEEEECFVLTQVMRVTFGEEGVQFLQDRFFASEQPTFLRKSMVLLWRPLHPDFDHDLIEKLSSLETRIF